MTSEKARKLVRSSKDDAPPPKRQATEEVFTGRELPDSEMEESSPMPSLLSNLSNDAEENTDPSKLDLIQSLEAGISLKIAQLAMLGHNVSVSITFLFLKRNLLFFPHILYTLAY